MLTYTIRVSWTAIVHDRKRPDTDDRWGVATSSDLLSKRECGEIALQPHKNMYYVDQ